MSAGTRIGAPQGAGGAYAGGDQRTLGRRAYAQRAGMNGSNQNDDEVAWLKYLGDVGRGVAPTPRARGFAGVQRR